MIRKILGQISGFVPAAIVCIVPVALVFLDVAVLGLDCNEVGVVEISQSAMLLASVVIIGFPPKYAAISAADWFSSPDSFSTC